MSNLEMAQKFGWDTLKELKNGVRAELLMLPILETIMELLAAIADKMDIPNTPMYPEQEDE